MNDSTQTTHTQKQTAQTPTPAPAGADKQPGFFSKMVQKLDNVLKQKADAKAQQGCCCSSGDDKGKGGKCC